MHSQTRWLAIFLLLVTSLSTRAARAQAVLAAEPAVNVVHTVDGSVGPGVALEGGYEVDIHDRFRVLPLVRLSAGYMGEARPLTAGAGLRLEVVFKPAIASVVGFGGLGDGGDSASHGLQPLGGGGVALDILCRDWLRIGAQVDVSALIGDKSTVWMAAGPRVAVRLGDPD